jgi:hypothetical protein
MTLGWFGIITDNHLTKFGITCGDPKEGEPQNNSIGCLATVFYCLYPFAQTSLAQGMNRGITFGDP